MARRQGQGLPNVLKKKATRNNTLALSRAVLAAKQALSKSSQTNRVLDSANVSSEEDEDINPAFSKANLRTLGDGDEGEIVLPEKIEDMNPEKVEDILKLMNQLGDPDADLGESENELGQCDDVPSDDSLGMSDGESHEVELDSFAKDAKSTLKNSTNRVKASNQSQVAHSKKKSLKKPVKEEDASEASHSLPPPPAKHSKKSGSVKSTVDDKSKPKNSPSPSTHKSPKKKVARRPFKKSGARRKARSNVEG